MYNSWKSKKMKSTSNGIVLILPSTRGTTSFKIRLSPYIEAGSILWCRNLVLLCGCDWLVFCSNLALTCNSDDLFACYYRIFSFWSLYPGLYFCFSWSVLVLKLWSHISHDSCSWLLLLCWAYPCLCKEGLTVFPWRS